MEWCSNKAVNLTVKVRKMWTISEIYDTIEIGNKYIYISEIKSDPIREYFKQKKSNKRNNCNKNKRTGAFIWEKQIW